MGPLTIPQHKQITGYRDLSETEIRNMNQVKEMAGAVGDFLEVMEQDPTVDKRWVAIAKTQLQQGFMALTRSIAQPTTF